MEKLKLKTRMTISAKKNMEEMVSRLRISQSRSFQATTRITLKKITSFQVFACQRAQDTVCEDAGPVGDFG